MPKLEQIESVGAPMQFLFNDVKNCLNNIAIAAALLEDELIEQEELKEYAKEIQRNCSRIKLLISGDSG